MQDGRAGIGGCGGRCGSGRGGPRTRRRTAWILVALMVNNYIGRIIYGFYDCVLFNNTLFNKIYTALKQIGEALFSADRTVFRAVAMIEYPRRGMWSLVFMTEVPGDEMHAVAGERLRSVFLPTTPNPTSGFLLMVPEKDLYPLRLTVEEGLKMVISGGAIVPGELAQTMEEPDRVKRRKARRSWFRFGRKARPEPASEESPPAPAD